MTMTKDEALRGLTIGDCRTRREAVKTVKELLNREECEDAISRQAVLDKKELVELEDGQSFYCISPEDVETLPPVNPTKTGHWILQPSNKEQGERDFIWWKCSECGQVIYSETEKDRREYHAFCGRCGAKMVELQESKIVT
jgi:hypothetical protein